ncbi:MAG: DUF4225 domain-containing protein [Providencia heimbachae]|nr:DUF4225 domain-containing protein [Providencia heimbachae]
MAMGYFLRVGDKTTCGGQILTGDNTFQFYGASAARQGDIVTCGKHSGTYNILGGISNVWGNGRMMAGILDSFSSCPCKARLINSIQDSYAKEDEPVQTRMAVTSVSESENAYTQTPQQSNTLFTPTVDNRIRIDAQQLIDCADDLCDEYFYYPDIKNAFRSEIEAFAGMIVEQVESGKKSYEQGSEELKQEEKSLKEQAFDLVTNGLSVIGGVAMTGVGIGLCSTGLGCLIGAPLIAHGANGIYEGAVGIIERKGDVQGPLREGYKQTAKALGFNESVGNLAYDLIDLGISAAGKLKLVPKLNEYGNPNKNLFFKDYMRKDLEYAYKQMKSWGLMFEIVNDGLAITKIKDDIKNLIVIDKENNHISLVIGEPEKITNVKEIVENCYVAMLITGGPDDDDSLTKIRVCYDKDGNRYQTDLDNE